MFHFPQVPLGEETHKHKIETKHWIFVRILGLNRAVVVTLSAITGSPSEVRIPLQYISARRSA